MYSEVAEHDIQECFICITYYHRSQKLTIDANILPPDGKASMTIVLPPRNT